MSLTGGTTTTATASEEAEGSMIKEIVKDSYNDTYSSSDPTVSVEKADVIDNTGQDNDNDQEDLILSHEEQFPIDPDAQEESHQFTIRAVFVGCCLGGVIAASK